MKVKIATLVFLITIPTLIYKLTREKTDYQRHGSYQAGVTIWFPRTWTVKHKLNNTIYTASHVSDGNSLIMPTKVTLTLAEVEDDESIDNFLIDKIQKLESNNPSVDNIDKGKISMNKIKGRWISFTHKEDKFEAKSIIYILIKDGYAFLITCSADERDFKEYKGIFRRIAKHFEVMD